MTLGEMFLHLKRHLEPELDKTVIPLILKSGDTNKFLREDCHVALDHIVESNVAPAKLIAVLTADLISHKNPVVRTTTSRLLAYIIERMGVAKALSGTKDITDKLLPAVAKLAQDGSQEARNYAKAALHRMMVEHEDFERLLKKFLTQNMMRSLEKVLDALRNPPGQAKEGGQGRKGLQRRKMNGRMGV